jgi:hypothetical protein
MTGRPLRSNSPHDGKPANDTKHTNGDCPTNIDIYDPITGERAALALPDWKMILAMLDPATNFRSPASIHVLSAMLAKPQFEPTRQDGEETAEAYARRACDYADALLVELQRRTAKGSGETSNTQHRTSKIE